MKIRLLSLILAVLTVVSLFAACGEGVETTLNTDESDDPIVDTDKSETNLPETEATDTEPAETLPTVSEPEEDFTLLNLDFETDLPLADYIAATEGIAINDALNGGEIKDGKWVYGGRALAIKDELGIYSLDYYSIEFDFCFNTFVNKDATSVFCVRVSKIILRSLSSRAVLCFLGSSEYLSSIAIISLLLMPKSFATS